MGIMISWIIPLTLGPLKSEGIEKGDPALQMISSFRGVNSGCTGKQNLWTKTESI
jgi:hypothetical protein